MATNMIQRRAVDLSGKLGSLYDACQDCILEHQTMTTNEPFLQLYNPIHYELIEGKTEKSENLLKAIGIDDDLRLNILLKSTLQTGIAEIVNYLGTMDSYTRFLYLSYADREQRLPDDSTAAKKSLRSILSNAQATHIITAVSFGIEVIVVLQLPNKENLAKKIDVALEKVRLQLENCTNVANFNVEDGNVLEKIMETKAYSNVTELTKMTSLLEICEFIHKSRKKSDTYHLLTYTLRPIQWLYPDAIESCCTYIPIEKNASDNLEHYLIKLLNTIKRLKYWFKYNVSALHLEHVYEQLSELRNQWLKLKISYEDVIKRLRNLVSRIHCGENDTFDIEQVLKHEDQITLKQNIQELMAQVSKLEEETKLFNSSQPQEEQNKYFKLFESQVNLCDDRHTLEYRHSIVNREKQTFGSNEKLNNNNQTTLFTEQNQESNKKNQNPSSQSSESKTSTTTSSSTADEIINVLLLGESGVGKSTFINAFVNYLKFKTFEQAESNEPAVLIPVSFVITTGNNFEEHIVKFGDSDSLNNEDFDHPGQSVTQHCKSYVFNLNNINGPKLRIIDTPGFGDTRGIDQDDLNIQQILEYINNLTHLNAICFLLKPNTSQINQFFQTCLTQLLNFLGLNACRNIIFCFTNARSTFYSPGDTAPLLKDILKSLSLDNISFAKKNAFCFDNESFRYLVALQKSITFDDQDKEEYELSWSKSVDESKRLCSYTCEDLIAFKTHDEQQSIKRAQFKINHMIRPMLEAMRNVLRNIILWNMDTPIKSIELVAKALHRPAAVCFTCEHDFTQKGNFWIAFQHPHEMQKECYCCECPVSQHMAIDYQLQYKGSKNPSNNNDNKMKKELIGLRRASVDFAYFLMHVAHSTEQDPFLIGITQMIAEENDISKRNTSDMNARLAEELRKLLHKYEEQIENMNLNEKYNKLPTIYELIQSVCDHPMVQIQMVAVKETQEELMKLYEYKVPKTATNSSIY